VLPSAGERAPPTAQLPLADKTGSKRDNNHADVASPFCSLGIVLGSRMHCTMRGTSQRSLGLCKASMLR
jgi:hypothetical protein